MSETPTHRLSDAQLVDALRALGVHSARIADGAMRDQERAYLLGSLLFVIESELSDYTAHHGNEGGPAGAYEVMSHAARGHAHLAATVTGRDPYGLPDGMPDDVAQVWWLILVDRINLLSLQFLAAQDFGGSKMTNTPAHKHLTDIAHGLADVLTALTALNYRMRGVNPEDALDTLRDGAAMVESAGEFLRSTSDRAIQLKPTEDGPDE